MPLSAWLPIEYRDFYDLPRLFVVRLDPSRRRAVRSDALAAAGFDLDELDRP